MSYEELFAAHVLPVVRMRRLGNGSYLPIRWLGTGFTFGEGTFVTCWHCVSSAPAPDEVDGVARREGWPAAVYDRFHEVVRLNQDQNVSDLALGRLGFTVEPALTLAERPLAWGEDVVACGYPLSTDTRDAETGTPLIKTEARLLRGYVTRMLISDDPRWPPLRAVELDMPAPIGISGGPVFRPQPLEMAGVVYDEHVAQGEGEHSYSFAIAHHLSVLAAACGPATDGRPLAEYLRRP